MPNKTQFYNLVKPLVDEFYDVAVQNGNMEIIDAALKSLADSVGGIDLTTIQNLLTQHLAEKTNPHAVTKAQVGLGNVENYTIASKTIAESGISNTNYMSPVRTMEQTKKYVGNTTNLLTTSKDNIVNSINELFTDVSNGKDLIGTAITDTDPSKIVPTNPTFLQLSDLIRSITVGRKEARGEAFSNASGVFTVGGLAFNPTIIITYQDSLDYDKRPLAMYVAGSQSIDGTGVNYLATFNNILIENPVVVRGNSFTIDTRWVVNNRKYYWFAFE